MIACFRNVPYLDCCVLRSYGVGLVTGYVQKLEVAVEGRVEGSRGMTSGL